MLVIVVFIFNASAMAIPPSFPRSIDEVQCPAKLKVGAE